jgi:uncharacterized protein
MDKVIHFEIPADDIKRAEDFYQEVFGWKINDMPEMNYVIVHTGPTDELGMLKEQGFINGGMMKRKGEFKNPVITINVDDIDKTTVKILAKGGKVIKDKMDVGEMGYTAYFIDCEGNMVGLWENKRK